MLILTRRCGESILIGTDIEVAVLSIDRNQVRIGICAPDYVDIVREELMRRTSSKLRTTMTRRTRGGER